MGVPEGSFAVAAFVVIALPGLIYAGIRRWLRGEAAQDRDVGLSIARGATFAVALTALYLLLFGAWLSEGLSFAAKADALSITNPSRVGFIVLVFYVVIPGVVSLMLLVRHVEWFAPSWPGLGWIRLPRSRYGISSTPTAWEHATDENEGSWVKVKRGNGEWVGGWYTRGSFVTTYPEQRSLYIDEQYEMSRKGKFGKKIPDTGVFLVINDDDIVFWSRSGKDKLREEGHDDREEASGIAADGA